MGVSLKQLCERGDTRPWAVVATAHPPKFETVIEPLLGQGLSLPPSLVESLARPARADLQARAKSFGLQDDTPVYVKLLARVSDARSSAKKVDVVRVEQFGSPTPVRDCGMTGVVTPAAT